MKEKKGKSKIIRKEQRANFIWNISFVQRQGARERKKYVDIALCMCIHLKLHLFFRNSYAFKRERATTTTATAAT